MDGDIASLEFPKLPDVAMQLLQLATSKEHSLQELIALLAQDLNLQQQILCYAQLPFMQAQYQADPQTEPNVQHVIEHILGFETVSHIALGVAASRVFDAQRVADLEDFWRHAFYAAAYAKSLSELVAPSLNINPVLSYMAGLFHNFGLLLFSQLYPPEYTLLKKWLALYPKTDITILEQRLLGMGQAINIVKFGHAQIGAWLLQTWKMPEEICVITKEHHTVSYAGNYMHYVKIIQLTNQLLRAEGIGDGTLTGVPEKLLAELGLTLPEVYKAVEIIKAGAIGLDSMARSLTDSK